MLIQALLHESERLKKHKQTTKSRKSKYPDTAALKGLQSDEACSAVTTIASQDSKASHPVKQPSEMSVVDEVCLCYMK